jgi:hypothetical protein
VRQADLNSEPRIRVAVAESTRMSNQLIVGALRRIRSNLEVHALPSDSLAALEEIRIHRPEVALISAQLQDGPLSGFKVLHQISNLETKTPTVMLLDSTD